MKGLYMKKIILSAFAVTLFANISFADCCSSPLNQSPCQINPQKTECETKKPCEKCIIDDDEYSIYNECYFDKHFRMMKTRLCLTEKQECNIDIIYKKFKSDMENLHTKYRLQKNKVLKMVECSDKCYKEEANELKEIKKEIKNRVKCFRKDVKSQLCKSQYKAFRKFNRQEKRRVKRIVKYGAIYKFPCKNCCK